MVTGDSMGIVGSVGFVISQATYKMIFYLSGAGTTPPLIPLTHALFIEG